ncbi:MAG: hypothetical protein QNJ45_27545 [Ardenticatenaceae bacterium]|nr:hypothetical protein [Ardenticatenaceae bacterium]
MAQKKSTAANAIFVVRIWREWSLEETRWVGRIEQLNTGAAIAFRDLAELMTFLQESGVCGEARRSPSGKDQAE